MIPVQCDHENPEQVKELFDRINKDEKGQLDILVNNAYKGVNVSQRIKILPLSFKKFIIHLNYN